MAQAAFNTSGPLLEAISASNEVGTSVRYDPLYDQIIEARREDDADLPQGVWEIELKQADWQRVEEICTEILTRKSKDLQVAAWLCEGWLQREGLVGLNRGLQLICDLCQRYWDNIYPQIQDGDFEYRLSPFEWANDKLAKKIMQIKITEPDKDDVPSYYLSDYVFMHNSPDSVIDDGKTKLNLEDFASSQRHTSDDFFKLLYSDATSSMQTTISLEKLINDYLKTESLMMIKIKQALEKLIKYAENNLKSRNLRNENNDPQEKEKPMSTHKANSQTSKNDNQSPISSRREAYRILAEVAAYLEQAEPHSPTPYLVKKAILWGEMNLGELLQEFIQNNMDIVQIQKLLGMPLEQLPEPKKD